MRIDESDLGTDVDIDTDVELDDVDVGGSPSSSGQDD